MLFYTVVCGDCGWSYGPTGKKAMKQMLSMHREIHRLEKMLKAQE
jgi:hypothetical protein